MNWTQWLFLENLLKIPDSQATFQRFLPGRSGVGPKHLHFNNLSGTLRCPALINPSSDHWFLQTLINSVLLSKE